MQKLQTDSSATEFILFLSVGQLSEQSPAPVKTMLKFAPQGDPALHVFRGLPQSIATLSTD